MKQNKTLGVLAIAFTLMLSACGTPGSSSAEESVHKHTWGEWVVTTAATCTAAGARERTCTTCSEKQTGTVAILDHTWGEWVVLTEATCTEVGSREHTCTVCQTKPAAEEVAALGHVFEQVEGVDLVTWTSVATCTEAGAGTKVCTRCATVVDVTEAALGHIYEQVDGADLVTWTSEATCEEPGVGQKVCTRCQAVAEVTSEALGHTMALVGGEIVPEEGKAAVRLYQCSVCNVSYMGFKANEPSAESKTHLVIGADEGASFWGRPIGNALPLTEDGTSVNQQNGEVVYCTAETGDFFEYVFDLTAEQAAALATCRLYADAKPGNYLNGTDFWAYGSNNSEWTPGYYIDGAEGHYEVDGEGNPVMVKDHDKDGVELETEVKMGLRIDDYRYILYVDGEVKAFDPEIKCPTHGTNTNMRREEFAVPFTFNLHEGENRISLRMAGGYRSTFYNFTFRPLAV